MYITPRKLAKLRFCTAIILVSTFTLFTVSKIWISGGSHTSDASKLRTRHFYIEDEQYNDDGYDAIASNDNIEKEQVVSNEDINYDGVQAVAIKEKRVKEEAPGGLDYANEDAFENDVQVAKDRVKTLKQTATGFDKSKYIGDNHEEKILDILHELEPEGENLAGVEAIGIKGSLNTARGPNGVNDYFLNADPGKRVHIEDENVRKADFNNKGEDIKYNNANNGRSKIKDPDILQKKTGGMLPLINQSALSMDLFTNKEPGIPRIIHQTWDTYEVPETFIPWIKSVLRNHPTWKYMFWTQEDVQCYFKQKHPSFHDVYNSYWATIFKTDVMRYFLMYDYGGFYLDLDIESVQPLDIWTHYSACTLTHETYEQVFLLKDIDILKPNVMTTVLACRPFHPYYKMLQNNLVKYRDLYKNDVLRATGPHFMQLILDQYQTSRNNTDANDDVTIINPSYWLPTFDPVLNTKIRYRCLNKIKYLRKFAKDLCLHLMKTDYRNEPLDISYLDHHWVHTNLQPPTFKTKNLVDIRTVIPNLVSVQDALDFKC